MKPIRVGLVGFGSSAKTFHLPLLKALDQDFTVTAVVDRKGEESRRLLPEATVFESWEKMADSELLDVAVICLPNGLHAQVTNLYLKSGKHVIVEKPMAITTQETEAMIRQSQDSDRLLAVFQSRRLDGDFLTVAELLRTQTLGRIVHAEVRYDRWSNTLRKKAWKETGQEGDSLLEDLGSHLLDQALHLWGFPQQVFCRWGVQRDGSAVVDAFRISLDYDGLWVDLSSSMVVRTSPFHWSLQGTKGSFLKSGMDPQEEQLQKGLKPGTETFGAEAKEHWGVLTLAEEGTRTVPTLNGRYLEFYQNFAKALRGQEPLTFTAQKGQDVVRLLEACRLSAREGRVLTF